MIGKITPEKVFEDLVQLAFFRGYAIGCPDGRELAHAREKGKKPKDILLPGRLILRLPPKEREALSQLKPSMTNHRFGLSLGRR